MIRNVEQFEPLKTVRPYEGDDPHGRPTSATSVWHYTSAAGILGILQNDELWASSPITMNDLTEIDFGISIFAEAWAQFDKANLNGELRSLAESVFGNGGVMFKVRSFFIVSASKNGDSLNQWQGYTSGLGYAIQIATHIPLAIKVPVEFPRESGLEAGDWYDVIYEEKEQIALVESVIAYALENDFINGPDGLGVSTVIFSRIARIAARFKHSAFSAEQEVRYIQPEYPEMLPHFRQNGRNIVPFVKIGAGAQIIYPEGPGSKLPIVNVVVGPGNSEEQKVASAVLRDLLSARGYWPGVTLSTIPFRTA
jgi:hypothetical protein